MKKLLCLIFILSAFVAKAQFVKVSEFTDTYGTHDVGVLNTQNGSVIVVNFDSASDDQIMMLYDFTQLDDLITFFKQLKDKFSEWTRVALDNKVTEITKRIPLQAPTAMALWEEGDEVYGTEDEVSLEPLFSNDGDSGRKFYVFNAIGLKDSDDPSKTNTVHMNFKNAMQIQGLINALNPQRLRNATRKSTATSDIDALFK